MPKKEIVGTCENGHVQHFRSSGVCEILVTNHYFCPTRFCVMHRLPISEAGTCSMCGKKLLDHIGRCGATITPVQE